MPALDNLPPDQRAVLQMVLQRGRTYDEIAGLLSIDRAAVRQRALDGFDALAPAAVLPGPESALVTDYMLGQLPEKVAEQVYSYLQASDADRAWAQALAVILAPLGSLPEIPAGAPLGAGDRSAGGLERSSDPVEHEAPEPGEPYEPYEPADSADAVGADAWPESPAAQTPPASPEPWATTEWTGGSGRARTEAAREPRPSSRRGGAILLGSIAAVIVAVILVIALTSGGAKKHTGSTPPAATSTSQTASTTATTGTTTTAVTPTLLAQLNLKSPTGVSSTVGVAQVIREQGVTGIVIVAQGIPANTSHNAYAVWLSNSAGSFKFVGFVRNLVTKTGKLSAEGQLPTGAATYHKLLITLETQQKPSAPGEVVLSGPFREHP
jgi:hypothetical protein